MNLHTELLQFYRSKTLSDLLDRTSRAFARTGFPHLVLKWSPAPASRGKMLQNNSMIWTNFEDRFGSHGAEISKILQDSISIGLREARQNTLERQTWRLRQDQSYQLCADAPKTFYLTQYQRTIIRAFGEIEWREFVALPLSRERERVLVLEAKTQDVLSERTIGQARAVFSVFACVYQCLHLPLRVSGEEELDATPQRCLSRREVQCLHWLAAGKTFAEAAIILSISERTLRFHVGNAKEKLGVATTMQAVVTAALEYGFDPKDPRRSMYQSSRTPVESDIRKAG